MRVVTSPSGCRVGWPVGARFKPTSRSDGWRIALVAVALGLGLASPSRAQVEGPRRGEILGRVVDATTGGPIGEAEIEVVGGAARASTDGDGRFRIAAVPAGVVALRVSALGYEPVVRADVVVSTGKPVTVAVALQAAPVELEGITAGASYFPVDPAAPTSTQTLHSEEVRRLPGAQEDVIRAVSLLPGVAPTTATRNELVVRGGAPFENLFLVDGLAVPNIDHFGAQGSTGGTVSVVNLDFVREAEFSAGGFGAEFGDRVGSVTSLTLREGNPEEQAGEVNLSATGFGGIAEGPVGRGSYLVGVRRSYLDLILDMAGEPFSLGYWDGNAKVTQRFGERDELSWTFVGALDEFGLNNETAENRHENRAIMSVNKDLYSSGLTWSRWSDRSFLEVTAGRVVDDFNTFQNDSLGVKVFDNRSTEAENSLRIDFTRAFGEGVTLDVGAVAKYDDVRYDIGLPGFLRRDSVGAPRPVTVDTSFTALRIGSYGQAVVRWTPRFRTTFGARVDHYGHLGDAVRAGPRVAASLELGRGYTLDLSGGRYWQPPSFIWLVGHPSNPERLRPFRVDQGVLGVEKRLRPDLKAQLEVYYKRYGSYPARIWRPQAVLAPAGFADVHTEIPFGLEPLVSEGTGWAYGAELFVQKRLSTLPVYGLLSISLNRAEFAGLDGVSRIGAFDQPFIANLALGWRPGPLWDVGLKFRAASGRPSTPFIRSGPLEGRRDFERYNAGPRMPTFHALDVRVERRWPLGGLQLTTYIDVKDLYDRNYPIGYVWDDRERAPRLERAVGILPSVGINVEF